MGDVLLGECFSVEKITENVYFISETFNVSDHGKCNIWLSKGTALDVIIDTGLGIWDLVGFLKARDLIGEKPYMAIATHIHFDHSGGLYQFETTAIHEREYNDMKRGNQVNMVTFLNENDVVQFDTFNDYKVKSVTVTRALKDGDEIDQGDHKLQIMHLPGHTKGSIALYDIQYRNLFVGDVIYDGNLFDFLPTSSIAEYIDSCKHLIELAPRVDMVFPGHGRLLTGHEMGIIAERYIVQGDAILYKCSRNCLKCIVTGIFKGRNSNNIPCKCFYYGCCCFVLLRNI